MLQHRLWYVPAACWNHLQAISGEAFLCTVMQLFSVSAALTRPGTGPGRAEGGPAIGLAGEKLSGVKSDQG